MEHLLNVASPPVAYCILAILLMVAAFAREPLNLGGVIKTSAPPSIWTRAGFAVAAILLVGVAIYSYLSLNHAQWLVSYNELLNGAEGQPPPRWSIPRQYDELNKLAVLSATDYGENCLIASFVRDHNLELLPLFVQQNLQEADGSSNPVGYLKCYKDAINVARLSAATNHGKVAAFAPNSASTAILAALSSPGQKGWVRTNVASTLLEASARRKRAPAVYLYAEPASRATQNSVNAVTRPTATGLRLLGTTADRKWSLLQVAP